MIARTELGLVAQIGGDSVRVWGQLIITMIDGVERREPGLKHGSSTTPESELEAALSFLGAAGETFSHLTRKRIPDPFEVNEDDDRVHDGNHWLFQRNVTEWAANNADEIAMAQLDLQEGNIQC